MSTTLTATGLAALHDRRAVRFFSARSLGGDADVPNAAVFFRAGARHISLDRETSPSPSFHTLLAKQCSSSSRFLFDAAWSIANVRFPMKSSP